MKYFLCALIIFISQSRGVNACTAFSFTSLSGARYVAKNFDWENVSLLLRLNPATQNTYASMTLLEIDERGEHPTGGINSEGLIIEALYCPSSKQGGVEQMKVLTSKAAKQFAWIQRQLNVSRRVEDVILGADEVLSFAERGSDLHFFVCDAERCAVIDVKGGKVNVYAKETLPIEVVTNAPYEQTLQSFINQDRVVRETGAQGRFNQTVISASSGVRGNPLDHAVAALDRVEVERTLMKVFYDVEDRSVVLKSRDATRYQRFSLRQLVAHAVPKPLYLFTPPGGSCVLNSISQ